MVVSIFQVLLVPDYRKLRYTSGGADVITSYYVTLCRRLLNPSIKSTSTSSREDMYTVQLEFDTEYSKCPKSKEALVDYGSVYAQPFINTQQALWAQHQYHSDGPPVMKAVGRLDWCQKAAPKIHLAFLLPPCDQFDYSGASLSRVPMDEN